MNDKKDKYINKHLEKIEKGIVEVFKDQSIVEVFIDTFVEYVTEDIQEVLDLLPKCEGEGDNDE